MLVKDHLATLIEAGKATRLGPNWPGKRCLAKTRRATLCQKPAMRGRGRCQLHGGKSTGPRTPEGKARSIAAHTKHGRRSKAYIEKGKAIRKELKQIILECQRAGLLPDK
jgi:hypothetical protein